MTDAVKLSDFVLKELRSAILNGELEEGSLHSIYQLADRFEVSRTPVREAVLRLADTGMVTIEKNRGIRVQGQSADEIRRVFEMRLLLEVPASSHAALHLSDQLVEKLDGYLALMSEAIVRNDSDAFFRSDYALHDRILATLENSRLNEYVRSLRDITQNMGVLTTQHSRTLRAVGLEHEPVVNAIKAGDAPAAAAAMADHLVETGSLLLAQLGGGGPASSGWASNALRQLPLPTQR
ncbi:GntR family transcriptional regulator [Glaciihabitans sp. UYNi722]|uniref:GntR family transcriptional regulator n=1 Tax=Glaciihabitans sp. UYNi722 TaxID=3156344 RepID=UPI0033923F98